MMRKLIWGGVALAVCGGMAVCTAAHYAAEHPDSFLARCANMAAYVGSRCSPLLTFTSKPVNAQAVRAEIVCRPVCGHEPVVQQEPFAEINAQEAFEPIVIENPLPFFEGLEGAIDAFDRNEFVAEVTPVSEESEEPPQELTYDDAGIPRMPYADEEEDVCADETSSDCDWQRLLGWFWGATPRQAGACVPHCHFRMNVEQMIECIKAAQNELAPVTEGSAAGEPTPAESNDALEDAPTADTDEEPQDETGDSVAPEATQCPEDRHYHHHYPSCPYTGRCVHPYPYHNVAPREMQPVTAPAPAPENVAEPEESEAGATPVPKKKKYIFNGTRVVPAHPEIDTLECRPSDGPEDYDLDEPF